LNFEPISNSFLASIKVPLYEEDGRLMLKEFKKLLLLFRWYGLGILRLTHSPQTQCACALAGFVNLCETFFATPLELKKI